MTVSSSREKGKIEEGCVNCRQTGISGGRGVLGGG